MLEELEAAEKLPIRVLHPTLHHFFFGQVVDVLEVMQTDHQPRRLGWPADRAIEPAKRLVKARPRHQCRQPDQRMARIDDGIEALAQQIILTGRRTGWKHAKTPGNDGIEMVSGILQYFKPDGNPYNARDPRVFQGELLTVRRRAPDWCPNSAKTFQTTRLCAARISAAAQF